MSGGGGGILKAIAPIALMAIPGVGTALAPALSGLGLGSTAAGAISNALIGGVISGGIGAATGSKNPLQDALFGGAASGLGSALLGGSASGAADAAGSAGQSPAFLQNAPNVGLSSSEIPYSSSAYTDAFNSANPELMSSPSNTVASAASSDPSTMSKIGNYILAHPGNAALLGATGLTALDYLMPHKQVKPLDNGYNDKLPQYHVETTQTPYTGNWNTYAQIPETPMIESQLVRGPGTPYARGGQVNKTASAQSNPLAFASDGRVPGIGAGGQTDDVPAMLSEDEYVMPADAVSALGDGSSKAGGKKLDEMVKNVRKHKAKKTFPPKAKNPLVYIGGA